ncbi:MAG TPA: Rieske 2Fe-2S domain-containing protein [Kiritimatiellia bacterium]|jgi:nitrite reductase/ring-hydroxylating ferredoxin subunit/multimeric flavodoxin WrbA
MADAKWHDLGPSDSFTKAPLTEVHVKGQKLAISFLDGKFGAVSGQCNHAGGPLGQGKLDGEYIVCPWHHWKFHCRTGKGEPGYEEDAVPCHEVKVEGGHLWINLAPASKRSRKPHPHHPLDRPVERADGPIRIAGISTTGMDRNNPRYSTSEALLQVSLDHAKEKLGCETKMIRLSDLKFRNCEGYYSKAAHACTWPCSITQMDKTDEMTAVYEAMVFWADVILLATPIRWGSASALYFKMAERLNCVQNQVTIADNVLIRNKVAAFIITGGQDNIQGVAGGLLSFFSELGFSFPQFPFIAHSRGWSAEDMEHNVEYVMKSEELRQASRELAERSVETAKLLLGRDKVVDQICRGGRKAHRLDVMQTHL